jgi:predicted TIM-barrel fold metal-dependent hydrolase
MPDARYRTEQAVSRIARDFPELRIVVPHWQQSGNDPIYMLIRIWNSEVVAQPAAVAQSAAVETDEEIARRLQDEENSRGTNPAGNLTND